MLYFKLLVFSTVYGFLFTLSDAHSKLSSDKSPETKGFCYDILAGTLNIGSVLQIKSFQDGIHKNLSFIELQNINSNSKNNSIFNSQAKPTTEMNSIIPKQKVILIQTSESDKNFTPLKSNFETYEGQKLVDVKTSTFEPLVNQILIQTLNFKSKTPVKTESPKGLVLSAQMTDLLFSKKQITDIKPEEKMIFQTFSESLSQIQQTQTELEPNPDHLILNHFREGESFTTRHSSEGDLLSSHFKTKNISLKSCTSQSVLTHLNSALNHKKFKSLFSFDDREKIKKCCPHY